MKTTLFLLVATLLFSAVLAIPYAEQRALANSLQVGRKSEPSVWDCADCNDDNRPISTHRVQNLTHEIVSIVSVYDEFVVLAFRYTANLKNVWQDILWAFQVKDEHTCHNCKVQREYDRMWASIRDTIIQDLSAHSGRKLIVTGISLGGGLACLSYVDIQHAGLFQDIEVITFGAPRVGNKYWAQWFDQNTDSRRYFIRRDPIAFLPRCLTPICNYRQTGQAIKCFPGSQTCKAMSGEGFEIEDLNVLEMSREIVEAASTYDHNEEVGGILDHVFGYKKIYNYTLIA